MPRDQIDKTHRSGASAEYVKWERLAAGAVTEGGELCDQVVEELAALLRSFDPSVEHVLEAGCGSGLTGIGLIQRGFTVELMDFSPRMLERAGRAADRHLPAEIARPSLHCADLFDATPETLGVAPFDCVFNAGVLEHYDDADIVELLRAMGRLSRRYVVALVPNSRCVAYRWWRWRHMNLGSWPYGRETPRTGLAGLVEQAGLEPLLEVPMAQLGALEMAREISPTSGELLDWLAGDDLPEELSSYLICCAATVRGAAGRGERPDPRDLLLAAQRGWLGSLRSAQRRWSLSLAREAQAATATRERLSALQEEHRHATRRHRGEVEQLLEQVTVAAETRHEAERRAAAIEAHLGATESRLESEKQALEEKLERSRVEHQTAAGQYSQELEQVRLEYRVALVAARAETGEAARATRERHAELESELERLEADRQSLLRSFHATRMEIDSIKETLGYRLLCRLRTLRHRLLFLSATHELRPTVKSLLQAVFCWPWRLLLPPAARSALDARIGDPVVFHESLRVHTARPQRWIERGHEVVDTRQTAPRTVRISLIATVLDEGTSVMPWLQSLARQTRMPDELVVVDGGSSDDTVEALRQGAADLPYEVRILVEPGCNIARGRNVALAAARHDFVAVTDAGCELSPGWLAEIAAPFEHDPAVDGVIGWSEMHPASPPFCHRNAWLVVPALEETDPRKLLPSSRSFAFRRALGLRLGGYPEHLTKWAEDTLFSLNLAGIGARWAFAPEAVVFWRGPSSWRRLFRLHRNYLLGNGEARIYQATAGRSVREILTLTTLLALSMGLLAAGVDSGAFPLALATGLLAAICFWRGGHTRWALANRHRWNGWYRWPLRPILGCWLTGLSETVGSLHGLYRSRRRIVQRLLDRDRETIVFLASHDWFWMKQRLGHLADSLRRRGLQVVFCPNNWVQRLHGGLLEVPGKIVLCNDEPVLKLLRRPIFYTAAAGHYAAAGAVAGGRGRRIFDLIDAPRVAASTEAEVAIAARRAEVCLTVSEVLARFLEELTGVHPLLVPNGVDPAQWSPDGHPLPKDLARLVEGGSSVVGYVGALGWWIDFELLRAAAEARPAWRFVLVGPVLCEETFAEIAALPPNVHHLGLKVHTELPAYVGAFTVGLIPFCLGEETQAADPVKLYEYAAMEVPIVSTDIPRCRDLAGVQVARSSGEFIACLDRAVIARHNPESRRALREFALKNSWDRRADEILRALGLADRYPERHAGRQETSGG